MKIINAACFQDGYCRPGPLYKKKLPYKQNNPYLNVSLYLSETSDTPDNRFNSDFYQRLKCVNNFFKCE